ncbi:MAG: hypothetical protein HN849_18880 [Victivallales bacterium]|nr:hypothetical protein [Victivallales bacterium]
MDTAKQQGGEASDQVQSAAAEDTAVCNLRWMTVGLVALLALLGVTLFVHQVIGGGVAATALERRQAVRLANVPAERAPLLASGGEVLVYSKPVYRFVLDLKTLRHPRERLEHTVARVAGRLALFGQKFDPGTLPLTLSSAQIEQRIRASGPLDFVLNEDWGVSPEAVARFARFRGEFPEIRLELWYRRECVVPGPLANTLGRVGWRSPRPVPGVRLWYARKEMRGLEGLEKALENLLCGTSGYESIVVDAMGFHRVGTLDRVEPVPAKAPRTTIDLPVQRLGERCFLSDGTGAFLVLQVGGSQVRALGSAPFAPYAPTLLEYRELKGKSVTAPFLDRARRWRSPPGSVFKMIPIIAALASGKLDPEQRLFCNGKCRVGARAKARACWKSHGSINVAEALAFSCNSFAYEAAKLAGPENVVLWARRFGIGADPQAPQYGLGAARSQVMAKSTWHLGEIYNLAIGKGETLTTMVALANYGAALATRQLVAPVYVEEDSLPDEARRSLVARAVRPLPLPAAVQEIVFRGMLACTEMRGGTGGDAACSGLRVLAKTGTAVLTSGKQNALMLVLVPAERPKYCIVCAIQDSESGGGGTVGPRMGRFLEGLVGLGRLSSGTLAKDD